MPVWAGHLLALPFRRLTENPEKILGPHVKPGMTVLDLGCAMGYFSLPLAKMVGPEGKVICVDLQAGMLKALERRATKRGLDSVIELRECTPESLKLDDLHERADLALAFHVLHEAQHPARFLAEAWDALKPGGRLLLAELKAHVSLEKRAWIFQQVEECDFEWLADLSLRRSEGAVYRKPVERIG
jgi:ubiquinone/menaquinone biosynthesis C-methylase UbiE